MIINFINIESSSEYDIADEDVASSLPSGQFSASLNLLLRG